jgi:hypothetical protein
MLSSASNINQNNLKFFLNNEEITTKFNEISTLEENFPESNININISIENRKKKFLNNKINNNNLININLNKYCSFHYGKYSYFYCYNCKKSLCSECLKNNKHINHNLKEKYDYLEDSKILIEKIINKKIIFNNENNFFSIENEINEEFENLIKIIKKFKKFYLDLIKKFNLKEKNNIEIYNKNLEKIKEFFIFGLNELKNKINIENIINDEKIFLIFDKKINEIEKNSILNVELNKIQKFNVDNVKLKNIFENVINEINNHLNNVINNKMRKSKKLKIILKIFILKLSIKIKL